MSLSAPSANAMNVRARSEYALFPTIPMVRSSECVSQTLNPMLVHFVNNNVYIECSCPVCVFPCLCIVQVISVDLVVIPIWLMLAVYRRQCKYMRFITKRRYVKLRCSVEK